MANRRAGGGAGARVLRLLQCVAESQGTSAVRPLAKRLRLPASTVHRLLQILVAAGMAERAGGDDYRPGRTLFRMSARLLDQLDVRAVARPVMRRLWDAWGETCTLCLYSPTERSARVIDTMDCPQPLRYIIEPHATIALAWGSLGHAILAHLPGQEIDRALAQSPRGPLSGMRAPRRVVLLRELQRIRRRGYAVYQNRGSLDIAGVAAPLFGPSAEIVGCLGMVMPASRLPALRRKALGAAVKRAAGRITAALGGDEKPGASRLAIPAKARDRSL